MRIYSGVAGLVVGILFAGPAAAQTPSVVQLPSSSYFMVDTTVSVPDRGTASLGGIGRASGGSTAFGPALGPPNRAFGRSLSSSNVSVRATIHDFEALDRATLERARAGTASASRSGKLRRPRPRVAASSSSAERVPPGSVADARRLHAAEVAAQAADAQAHLDRARRAIAKGKPSVAKIYYKMALRQARGDLKSQINRELAALSK